MIRLAIRAAAHAAEPVLAAVCELAPRGFEQVDGPGWVEYALYGAAHDLPALADGPAELGGHAVTVRGEPVADDWGERWREFHRAVLVGERLWVRPPWEAPPATGSGVLDLVIDPGAAFGTGAHPTTRDSLELLLEAERARAAPPGSFVDLGCGSGVLAIAAARLGFGPVAAVDHDPAALAATRDNARLNGVALDSVELVDLSWEAAPAARVVAANLTRGLLMAVAERMPGRPELLILAGLLTGEADEVAAAFAPLEERRRLTRGGWSTLLLASR